MKITFVARLKVVEALKETTIGSSKPLAYRGSDTMKKTKTILEKLARYIVYMYIYNKVITFKSDQTLENLRLLQEIKV